MNASGRWIRIGLVVALGIVLVVLPQLASTGYIINAMLDAVRWTIFALAFDLLAGHVGAVSLGQPAFYGLGAYVTALVGAKLHMGFLGRMLLSAAAMAVLALATGIAFFRIRGVTFAIGTLGAAIMAQLLVNNAVGLTGGAMCTAGIPRPQIGIPFTDITYRIASPTDYFYLLLPFLGITVLLYWTLVHSRIGRAFTAVREDELRASAVGIFPLRYKLLAFALSAGLIGALGSFQAQYVTVVCPTELSQDLTTTLLIMVFVGGVGHMRGVIIGALLFSALPRLLESGGAQSIPPAYQQMAYGVILVTVMLFLPDGLEGLIKRVSGRGSRSKLDGAPS
jgi:ABC-type branched-subunit amino acid transport system permease subunit